MTGLVLLGVSARALAEPVAGRRSGVTAVDFFGDRDLEGVVKTYALGRDLGLPATAGGLAEAARRLGAEAVVYGSNLENHPRILDRLAQRCELLGNDAATVREVRDWRRLRDFCLSEGVGHAATLLPGEEHEGRRRGGAWLVKRARSGGGHGVRLWRGEAIDREHVLQERMDGRPASVSFVADGSHSVVFAFAEQLVGRDTLGASGFAWCGNLLPGSGATDEYEDLSSQVTDLAARLTHRFGLRGVNGADVIIVRDAGGRRTARLIEVNPRYSASMELAQRARGVDVLAMHLAACSGRLPAPFSDASSMDYHGKAIVYARRPVRAPRTDGWYELDRRDIPHSGRRIAAGHPVCTVLASASARDGCLALLESRADAVYGELRPCGTDGAGRVADAHESALAGRLPVGAASGGWTAPRSAGTRPRRDAR